MIYIRFFTGIMSKFAKATENYSKFSELDNQFVFCHIQLAVAYYKSDKFENSFATLQCLEEL